MPWTFVVAIFFEWARALCMGRDERERWGLLVAVLRTDDAAE